VRASRRRGPLSEAARGFFVVGRQQGTGVAQTECEPGRGGRPGGRLDGLQSGPGVFDLTGMHGRLGELADDPADITG
jgi:hypothetical protein